MIPLVVLHLLLLAFLNCNKAETLPKIEVTFATEAIPDNVNTNRATMYGEACISECQKIGSYYYWCETNTMNVSGYDYCSPSDNIAVDGLPCTSDCSNAENTPYSWCKVGSSWNYCSLEVQHVNYGFSTTGLRCRSECKRYGYYDWCLTIPGANFWDYCSVSKGTDIYGNVCTDECYSYGGTKYSWCHVDKIGWNYCSVEKDHTFSQTSNGHVCTTACEQYGYSYIWCWYITLVFFPRPVNRLPDALGSTMGYSPTAIWDYCSINGTLTISHENVYL